MHEDAGDHDHVAPREHRARGRVAQLVDLVVDRGVLLDVCVRGRQVRLGLVVVVVGDEVFHGVVREELAELAVELRRERLVRRHDQSRPPHALDHPRHGRGLAAARDAQQRLVRLPLFEPRDQFIDGPRLVAARNVVADDLELRHPRRRSGEPRFPWGNLPRRRPRRGAGRGGSRRDPSRAAHERCRARPGVP